MKKIYKISIIAAFAILFFIGLVANTYSQHDPLKVIGEEEYCIFVSIEEGCVWFMSPMQACGDCR